MNKNGMTGLAPQRPWVRGARSVSLAVGVLAILVALIVLVSHRQDRRRLRDVTERLIADVDQPSEKVLTLLHWVHHHGDTARNPGWFLFRSLRATPGQVLARGGDCADKSRLLGALLGEIGLASTMAMCFDPSSGMPVHTVLEVDLGSGERMLVDPAYDLSFPKASGVGFHGLVDLRHDPRILPRRLDELRAHQPRISATWAYNRASAVYDSASTVNWNRNGALRLLHDRLYVSCGDALYRLPRPAFMEEPKVHAACLALAIASISLSAFLMLGRRWVRDRLPRGGCASVRSEGPCHQPMPAR